MRTIVRDTIKIITCMVLLGMMISSCKKFVTIDPPKDQLTLDAVFANDELANAAMRGLYAEMVSSFNNISNGALSLFPCLSADELIRTSSSPNYDPYTTNSLSPTDIRLSGSFWQRSYFHIYQSNAIIENVQHSPALSTAVKNQLLGEAKFFRAFFHFYLVNLFGAVPLITSTDYRNNAALGRTDTALIYDQLIKDLKDAQALLSTNYPTAEKIRVNQWAATALLARIYLFRKDWTNAETESSKIIASSSYSLPSLDSVFVPNNTGAILQFQPPLSAGLNTAEGFNFIPSSATTRPNFVLTQYLLNAFETGDARKLKWTKTTTVSGVSYTYPYKYKIRTATPGAPRTEYYIVLRLAEQYLIRAEARARLGKLPTALADLNLIRSRAGVSAINSTDATSVLSAIEKERQVEFFIEWGHRWFDLKRTGNADAVLGTRKAPNWQPADQLYPIPQSEINANPALTQNPGY